MHNELDSFVRTKEVAKIIGVSVTKIYKLLKSRPDFPKPIYFGPAKRVKVFSRQEINSWIEQIKLSRDKFV
jgi:predicted DNA-binding transcriptional regulator AlpA